MAAIKTNEYPKANYPRFRTAHVKIQSVRHTHFENKDGAGRTLGAEIDELLAREGEEGRFPNKLVLEINPPEELDANQME